MYKVIIVEEDEAARRVLLNYLTNGKVHDYISSCFNVYDFEVATFTDYLEAREYLLNEKDVILVLYNGRCYSANAMSEVSRFGKRIVNNSFSYAV